MLIFVTYVSGERSCFPEDRELPASFIPSDFVLPLKRTDSFIAANEFLGSSMARSPVRSGILHRDRGSRTLPALRGLCFFLALALALTLIRSRVGRRV